MAKKKSTAKASRGAASTRSVPPTDPAGDPPRRSPLRTVAIVVGVLVIAGGGLAFWSRKRDPSRAWGRTVEQAHATKIDTRMAACFGGNDGAAIRQIIPAVRRGDWPAPFRECAGPGLTNVIASALDFATDIMTPPDAARSAKLRERDKLDRLRGSLTNLQRVTVDLDRTAPVPVGERDRLVTALEDVAVDADAEKSSMADLISAANSGASWF